MIPVLHISSLLISGVYIFSPDLETSLATSRRCATKMIIKKKERTRRIHKSRKAETRSCAPFSNRQMRISPLSFAAHTPLSLSLSLFLYLSLFRQVSTPLVLHLWCWAKLCHPRSDVNDAARIPDLALSPLTIVFWPAAFGPLLFRAKRRRNGLRAGEIERERERAIES